MEISFVLLMFVFIPDFHYTDRIKLLYILDSYKASLVRVFGVNEWNRERCKNTRKKHIDIQIFYILLWKLP
mgnify:CR=1 FL=1